MIKQINRIQILNNTKIIFSIYTNQCDTIYKIIMLNKFNKIIKIYNSL